MKVPIMKVGPSQCFWCGDSNHLIVNCPARLSSQHKGPSSILKGTKAATPMANRSVGKAYVINRKQAHEAATIVTGTLIFNSVPLVVLFDSGPTHSFISSNAVSQIGHQLYKNPTNLLVSLSAGQAVECHVMFENCPLSIDQEVFKTDLIQFCLLYTSPSPRD